jgi:hypothetical protein
MLRRVRPVLVSRRRRSSMSSSGETTISVYASMPWSRRRNSARPSVKMVSSWSGRQRVGWCVADQKVPVSTSRR